jgi:hypothetical protein
LSGQVVLLRQYLEYAQLNVKGSCGLRMIYERLQTTVVCDNSSTTTERHGYEVG